MVPVLRAARDLLIERLQVIEGSSVEDNRFSVSVHWRNVAPTDRPAVEAIVDATLSEAPFAGVLRKNSGKCVYELRPDVRWDKGEAVLYLLELLRRRETDFDEYGDDDGVAEERIAGFAADEWYTGVLPVYVGDDVTDEDAFRAIAPFGAVSVLVCPSGDKVERPRATHATHTLRDVDDVRAFVDELASACAPSVRGR
jgi:trehalose 6-phosphate phosphatase